MSRRNLYRSCIHLNVGKIQYHVGFERLQSIGVIIIICIRYHFKAELGFLYQTSDLELSGFNAGSDYEERYPAFDNRYP